MFSRISSIYSDLKATFEATDVLADVSWWAVNCGMEMPVIWPKFEVTTWKTLETSYQFGVVFSSAFILNPPTRA